MAWGIFMTFLTLCWMMGLAIMDAATPERMAHHSSANTAPEGSAQEKPELPKAA